jgi:hypothetical protein
MLCSLSTFRLLSVVATLCLASPTAQAAASGKGKGVSQVKVDLTRPAASPDADAHGQVHLWTHEKQDRQRFTLKVHHVDVSALHELFIESGLNSGNFLYAGSLTPQGAKMLEFKADTKKGDVLPLGARSNSAFEGCRIEVRLGGDPILGCTIPGNPDDGDDPDVGIAEVVNTPMKLKVRLRAPNIDPPAAKMKGKLRLRSYKKKSKQLFRVQVRRAPFEEHELFLFIEDAPDSGDFVEAGELMRRGKTRKGRMLRNTKKGDALPVGISFLSQLAGREVQVRDAEGLMYLEGKVPAFD